MPAAQTPNNCYGSYVESNTPTLIGSSKNERSAFLTECITALDASITRDYIQKKILQNSVKATNKFRYRHREVVKF